jgi:hypothetical protein
MGIQLRVVTFFYTAPSEAVYRPVSRLPFACYCHNLFLLAAPRDHLTTLLVDHAGALRAAFRANVPGTQVHALCTLTGRHGKDAADTNPINHYMVYLLNPSKTVAIAPILVWFSMCR